MLTYYFNGPLLAIILKYFLSNKKQLIDCKKSHKKFMADVKSAEIGNTQLTKYAVRLEQQQQ